MDSPARAKYAALKNALEHAREGLPVMMEMYLSEAKEISLQIGAPLARSVEQSIRDIYQKQGLLAQRKAALEYAEFYSEKEEGCPLPVLSSDYLGEYMELSERLGLPIDGERVMRIACGKEGLAKLKEELKIESFN